MLPVLYKFTLQSTLGQVVVHLLGLLLVGYAVWAGWRGANGPSDPKTSEPTEPSREDRTRRAILFGVIGLGLAIVGLYYALPPDAFFGTRFGFRAKGEGIPIHTYGILVGGGFIAAVTVCAWLAQREWQGEEGLRKREQIFDLSFWIFIAAIVGSRVLFVIVNWKQYAARPGDILSLGGGLVFQGGLIGASAAAWFYSKRNKIDFLRLSDLVLPTVSLGAAFGRLGCFSAGCCWGDVAPKSARFAVNFPGSGVKDLFGGHGPVPSLAYQSQSESSRWVVEETGKVYDQAVSGAVQMSRWVGEHGHTFALYPTQLMDSALNLLLFVGLLTLRKYRHFQGQITGLWLMIYAVNRTLVELFRGDAERGTLHGLLESLGGGGLAQAVPLEAWYNISTGQFISLCMFALGATLLVRQGRAMRQRGPLALPAAA